MSAEVARLNTIIADAMLVEVGFALVYEASGSPGAAARHVTKLTGVRFTKSAVEERAGRLRKWGVRL
jgi:hypothetical protein